MPDNWSIGIYSGRSPLDLAPAPECRQPVLTAADVTDIHAEFVADPFMIRTDGGWTMLFEVLEASSKLGRIASASSADGLHWRYTGLALAEPFHLSYPFVFEWRGAQYMIPETLGAGCVRLYRADRWPDRWRHVADLVDGPAADPSIVRHADRWWLFTCPRPYEHDTLCVYFADDLVGPWTPHPANPVVTGDRRLARPAGRPLVVDGRVYRFAQDCRETYGAAVTAVEITTLSVTDYADRAIEPAILGHGSTGPLADWARDGMHQLDAHRLADGRWIACVDGNGAAKSSI